MITQMAERPPYVQFETRTAEDRDASIREGRYIARNIDYVLITPAGSKDVVERAADEWLKEVNRKATQNPPSYNPIHAKHFNDLFDAWKANREMPESGTPIRGWQMLSPAEQENVLSANVRTVEDLSALNEQGLTRIGMGARALQAKARDWLEAANNTGKVSAEVNALKIKTDQQAKQIEELVQTNRELMAELKTKRRKKTDNE